MGGWFQDLFGLRGIKSINQERMQMLALIETTSSSYATFISKDSMNTREKGRRRELQARDILRSLGYDVQMAPTPSRWARQTDLWGLYDLVGVKGDMIRFVQVKANRDAPKAWREKAKKWPCPTNCTKEVWIFKDGKKEPIIKIL